LFKNFSWTLLTNMPAALTNTRKPALSRRASRQRPHMRPDPETLIRALPCWRGAIAIEPLPGGLSNANFKVIDGGESYVARLGADSPFHHVSRRREAAAARWAYAAGLSPEVIHADDGALVCRYIDGRTYRAEDVRADLAPIVALIKTCHHAMPDHARGEASLFWVFHVLRDYAHTLREGGHPVAAELPRLAAIAAALEAAQIPLPIIFGHHDLLPANFIANGSRLWLIDWEYAAFGTPMFDLANVAQNAEMDEGDERNLLKSYFGRVPDRALLRSFEAMKVASALREALWACVSQLHLNTPGIDYVAYADACMTRFDAAYDAWRRRRPAL
jgi:thiamine kinase-like enzyme